MATFTKEFLSGGGADGNLIKVAETETPGTLIHTAHASNTDEVWLYAMNTNTGSIQLTVEFGGVDDPDDLIILTIPPLQGLVLIIPGLILSNSHEVRVFAGTANKILIVGFVNRIAA